MSLNRESLTKEQAELVQNLKDLIRVIKRKTDSKQIRDDLTDSRIMLEQVKDKIEHDWESKKFKDQEKLAEINSKISKVTEEWQLAIQNEDKSNVPHITKETTQLIEKVLLAKQHLPRAFNLDVMSTILEFSPTTVNQWMNINGILSHMTKDTCEWQDFYTQFLIDIGKEGTDDLTKKMKLIIAGKIMTYLQGQTSLLDAINSMNNITIYQKRKADKIWNKKLDTDESLEAKQLKDLKKYNNLFSELHELFDSYFHVLGQISRLAFELIKLDEKKMSIMMVPDWVPELKKEMLKLDNIPTVEKEIDDLEPSLQQQKKTYEKKIQEKITAILEILVEQLEDKHLSLHTHRLFKKLMGHDTTPVKLLKALKLALETTQTNMTSQVFDSNSNDNNQDQNQMKQAHS